MKRFDGTEIAQEDSERFRALVDSHRWIFAKTYAAFCPHEYTVQVRDWKRSDFEWFVKFIWDNGFMAKYGKSEQPYFIDHDGGWYYFAGSNAIVDGVVSSESTIVNRASLKEWELVDETSLFGTEYRWKRLPKDKRKKFD